MQSWIQSARTYSKKHRTRTIGLVVLVVLAGVIGLRIATQKTPEPTQQPTIKPLAVAAMRFGQYGAAQNAVGTITNQSTITLVAQSNGPVSAIFVKEGQRVARGTTLLQQTSTYAGGSSAAIQKELANNNLRIAQEQLASTVDQVVIAREQAGAQKNNAGDLRGIAKRSLDQTNDLISLTSDIVATIEDSIKTEEAGANNQATIQSLRQQLLTYKNSLLQAQSSQRSLRLQADSDGNQATLAETQYELAMKTTELQLTIAELQKNAAELNAQLADIALAATRISAPIAGTIEALYPKIGSFLAPGTPSVVIRGEPQLLLEVLLAGRTASRIDTNAGVTLTLPGEAGAISLPISHLSRAPVAGTLHQLLVAIPDRYEALVYENQTVPVALQLLATDVPQTNAPLIPLDAVFISNTQNRVFIAADNTAQSRTITTGQIIGDMIEVIDGIEEGELIILDRRVIDQQQIEVEIVPTTPSAPIELG